MSPLKSDGQDSRVYSSALTHVLRIQCSHFSKDEGNYSTSREVKMACSSQTNDTIAIKQEVILFQLSYYILFWPILKDKCQARHIFTVDICKWSHIGQMLLMSLNRKVFICFRLPYVDLASSHSKVKGKDQADFLLVKSSFNQMA